MKRRDFVATAAVGTGSIVPAVGGVNSTSRVVQEGNEYYEMRKYEISFRDNRTSLMNYLKNLLLPTLREAGGGNATTFKELGDAEPAIIWAMISYPSLEAYGKGVEATITEDFVEKSQDYAGSGKSFNRYTSFLLKAFDGMPQMITYGGSKNLFELRIYEGENEDAVRRKISMFDKEEITLFNKVGLDPVLFGNMLIGSHMPCLVYMLAFDNMDARSEAWSKFLAHPEWKTMLAKPEYANTVSNIRKIFLQHV